MRLKRNTGSRQGEAASVHPIAPAKMRRLVATHAPSFHSHLCSGSSRRANNSDCTWAVMVAKGSGGDDGQCVGVAAIGHGHEDLPMFADFGRTVAVSGIAFGPLSRMPAHALRSRATPDPGSRPGPGLEARLRRQKDAWRWPGTGRGQRQHLLGRRRRQVRRDTRPRSRESRPESVPDAEHHRRIRPGMSRHPCGSEAKLRQCHRYPQ